MAKKKSNGDVKTTDYRHRSEKRTNIPPAKIAAEGKVPRMSKVRYHYSPHLPPTLQFDPTGKTDTLPDLLAEAGRRPLTAPEQKLLADALRGQQPWLEWSGKREQRADGFFDVDPVALHIHERVSTQAMMRVLAREDVQRDLFGDPQQPYAQAVQFYRHEMDWTNRLILGDSLQVMTSLSRREHLAGKVQMIYLDPPYGIRFASNFQPEVGRRNVKDQDTDLSREPETVKAYRDSWRLGVHSYLSYLLDRFLACRDLLADTGSMFVQISDSNLHLVRTLLDEVFGPDNFFSLIAFKKTLPLGASGLPSITDYILWYTRDKARARFYQLYEDKPVGSGTGYTWIEEATGFRRKMTKREREDADTPTSLPPGSRVFFADNLLSSGYTPSCYYSIDFEGRTFPEQKYSWKTNKAGALRLIRAGRLIAPAQLPNYIRYFDDFPVQTLHNLWDDTHGAIDPVYVVQTSVKVIERCLLMATSPGDLVLDPTCGSGTTAFVAEQWGRRWITTDTSRVAIAIARQRLLTAQYDYYRLRPVTEDDLQQNAAGPWLRDPEQDIDGRCTLKCKTAQHVTLRSIAQNAFLDPIFEKHDARSDALLATLNSALKDVTAGVREKLASKLRGKLKSEGKRSVTEADRRRWSLPTSQWHHWEVPFDTDPDWPASLRHALDAYRSAWKERTEDVNECVAANAESEELVDRPEVVPGIVRVAGPFTVEGTRPEELSVDNDSPLGLSPQGSEEPGLSAEGEVQNTLSYLSQMVGHLRTDGVTFLGNQRRKFSRLDPTFEDASASILHAEGCWEAAAAEDGNTVAVSFGPQHGPVTALQAEEAIRAARQYDDLVLAGFSFDAEAFAVAHEQNHPKLRVHLAHIRPDLNEAMEGLLKDTPSSELFAVFGQPEIGLKETKDGWICTLKGVDIYNPLDNTVRSSGADKVAAWFLDSDFDGRCFCITQAFFPDKNAWEKIAKALGSSADLEAFEKLKGTTSLPFPKGKFGRIAVKVIDPRGNEVMAIRKLG